MKFLFLLFLCFSNKDSQLHVSNEQGEVRFYVRKENRRFNGDPRKLYYSFTGKQVLVLQGGSSGKLLHGPFERYSLSGNLLECGVFRNGLKSGKWLCWTETGNLLEVSEWKHGLRNGRMEVYGRNGSLLMRLTYRNGVMSGVSEWFSDGNRTESCRFAKGRETSLSGKLLSW